MGAAPSPDLSDHLSQREARLWLRPGPEAEALRGNRASRGDKAGMIRPAGGQGRGNQAGKGTR